MYQNDILKSIIKLVKVDQTITFDVFSGSLSNGVVLTKSHFRKCFGISFFALLNDLTDILLDEDTHPKVTESLESKSYSFDYFDKVVLSLQFSV